MRGRVYGTVAGSVSATSATFGSASAKQAGAAGELRTAALLNTLAERDGGPTVMHDLRIPGADANIDHLVISGNRIWVIDSKVWRPGWYVTLAGRTWRTGEQGRMFAPFEPGDKRTVAFAAHRLEEFLRTRAIPAKVVGKITTVWPSASGQKMRLMFYRPYLCHAVNGDGLLVSLRRANRPANAATVVALTGLLIAAGS